MQSFDQGTRELGDRIGDGKLVGRLEVDQIYALAQHSGFWRTGPLAGVVIRNHPQGGESHFLSGPLDTYAPKFFQRLADAVLGDSNGLHRAMTRNVEDLSDEVFLRAPREFDDLRNSAHPSVEDDGKIVYDRPPVRERLTKAALAEKAKRRSLGEGPRRSGPEIPFRG